MLAPQYLTVKQAAKRYGITTWLLYRLVSERKVPHARIGAAIRFDAAELDRFLRAEPAGGVASAEPAAAAGTAAG